MFFSSSTVSGSEDEYPKQFEINRLLKMIKRKRLGIPIYSLPYYQSVSTTIRY